jgi:hypothetical protein
VIAGVMSDPMKTSCFVQEQERSVSERKKSGYRGNSADKEPPRDRLSVRPEEARKTA